MDRETGNSKGQDARDDDIREADIASAYLRLATAKTPQARRAAWADLQGGIARRSPEQVHKMEERAGLAAAAEVPRG